MFMDRSRGSDEAHRRNGRGGPVVLLPDPEDNLSLHERRVHESIAQMIATITDREFAGDFPDNASGERYYYVPHRTLIGLERATSLGIDGEDTLYGGVVAQPFMASKAIMHALVSPDAARPHGWNYDFGRTTENSVLPGYTAFSRQDALEAVRRLLKAGTVRLKCADAAGGRGQTAVASLKDAETFLAGDTPWPLAIELHLRDMVTFSIGRTRLAGMTISYFGTQHVTRDNYGEEIYGGSRLTVVRSELDQLERRVTEEWRKPVRQVIAFESALQHVPGIIASRRNYDVAQGYDSSGMLRSGLIDQSWRIGGCSGIEVMAVRVFLRDPGARVVRGFTLNRYGTGVRAPDSAWVHFEGDDDRAGPMTVYTQVSEIG
jgi:uncharacterized protein DUF3182